MELAQLTTLHAVDNFLEGASTVGQALANLKKQERTGAHRSANGDDRQ